MRNLRKKEFLGACAVVVVALSRIILRLERGYFKLTIFTDLLSFPSFVTLYAHLPPTSLSYDFTIQLQHSHLTPWCNSQGGERRAYHALSSRCKKQGFWCSKKWWPKGLEGQVSLTSCWDELKQIIIYCLRKVFPLFPKSNLLCSISLASEELVIYVNELFYYRVWMWENKNLYAASKLHFLWNTIWHGITFLFCSTPSHRYSLENKRILLQPLFLVYAKLKHVCTHWI